MKAPALPVGIIAAGEGSRLKASHPDLPKPLIPVSGVPLCHWVVRSLSRAGISDFTVLLNSRGRPVRTSLASAFPRLNWTFLEKDTSSSWESFRLVSQTLALRYSGFIISTTDALVPPTEIIRFMQELQSAQADVGLALTQFVNDEKPLWADLDSQGRVRALGAEAREKTHVTCGIYYLTDHVVRSQPSENSFSSLRQYLSSLTNSGAKVFGVPLTKTLDIDRPEDIEDAEEFIGALKN